MNKYTPLWVLALFSINLTTLSTHAAPNPDEGTGAKKTAVTRRGRSDSALLSLNPKSTPPLSTSSPSETSLTRVPDGEFLSRKPSGSGYGADDSSSDSSRKPSGDSITLYPDK